MSFRLFLRRFAGILIACLLATPAMAAQPSPRTVTDEDAGWQFIRADVPHAETPQTDTHDWQGVSLPHTFVGGLEASPSGDGFRGVGWYRHDLTLDTLLPGRRYFLEFDGAALSSEVWVNGVHIGGHKGGFSRFRFDVTDDLHPGRNLIAVRIDSSRQSDMAPLGGDYTVFGGIYRPVRLISTSALHFDMLDYGGPGVYFAQNHVTADAADLSWKALIRNDGKSDVRARVQVRLLDASGRVRAETSQVLTAPAGQVTPATLTAYLIKPHLWQGVADPYLYTSEVTISGADGAVLDVQTFKTGIRDIRFDAEHGLFLNGKPYGVHGVDIHQSMRPGRGTAVDDTAVDEDFRMLEDMGVTGLRLAHYQHPQRDYDVADRDGLLLWTEIPLSSEVDPSPQFEANAADQLRELIRQNMNHPSVMVWGLGNEIYKSDEASNRILTDMNTLAHQEDPSRPTTYANCCGPVTQPHASHTDLLGSNVYFGWYSGEFSDLSGWADKARALIPHTPQAISEYGAGGSVHQEEDPPKRPAPASRWHPEQYQALYHEAAWPQIADMPWLWGSFIWAGFDFPSAGRKEGDQDGINDKGLITFDRQVKKDAYFWYQAQWSKKPMVYITSRRFTARKDPAAEVKIYTNQPQVTLKLNGKTVGTQAASDHIASWHVTLVQGENRVEASAGDVSNRVSWTLKSE